MNKIGKFMVAIIVLSTIVLLLDLFDVFGSKGIRFVCYVVICIAGATFFFVNKKHSDSEK
ncbi:hypothetical protein [Myroides phaeus]|uniref:Uncharacterized protein n=1 Tax=Myroides phaeus TaxID=702745 RepID=A0A1G8BNM4_9FLAO|nr:hypothetical protein [Myroides phaeus]MEC4116122.1 hypothetical protein [Myroides phaeus]SDH34825.1 hypothetical protein SAMN05421818_102161 [Myroides phaeus]